MLVSGIQRFTLFSCLVLSMALFLPKLFFSAGQEKVHLHSKAVGPGSVSAPRFSHGASSGGDQWTPESRYRTNQNPETFSQTKTSRKFTLLAQIAPLYGFGIFLYIIYIFYKLLHKDQTTKQQQGRFFIMTPEHTAQELSEDEMDELQTRLNQTEEQREKKTLTSGQNPTSYHKYRRGRKERKLHHLRRITHMVKGRELRDITPEEEAEETPYFADWEGYLEETFPQYEVPLCRHRYPSVILEEPPGDVPTPEELAERMEREDEEDEKTEAETAKNESSENEDGPKRVKDDGEHKQTRLHDEEEDKVGEDQPCLAHNSTDEDETRNLSENQKEQETSRRRRRITLSNHRHIFHYPKGGSVGYSYEDGEVEEDADNDDYDEKEENENKQDEDDNLQKMEIEMEDDPLVEAERLGFSPHFTCDPEEQEVNLSDFLLTYKPQVVINSDQLEAAEAPGLRMRYKKQKKN